MSVKTRVLVVKSYGRKKLDQWQSIILRPEGVIVQFSYDLAINQCRSGFTVDRNYSARSRLSSRGSTVAMENLCARAVTKRPVSSNNIPRIKKHVNRAPRHKATALLFGRPEAVGRTTTLHYLSEHVRDECASAITLYGRSEMADTRVSCALQCRKKREFSCWLHIARRRVP